MPLRPWGGLAYDKSGWRRLALQLRVCGATHQRTAELIGVSQPTVGRDLRFCREQYVVEGLVDDAAVAIYQRYAIVDAESLRELARKIDAVVTPTGTLVATTASAGTPLTLKKGAQVVDRRWCRRRESNPHGE